MFNPDQLKFALDLRGLSKADLAKMMEVTPRTITNYLKGISEPDLKTLGRILKFSPDFFKRDDLPVISEHAVSFRSYARMPAKYKKMALSYGVTAFILDDWINKKFELKTANLPDLSSLPPETAAQILRLEWSLGNKPIPNLIALLESKGIRIFSISAKAKEIDAFCVWNNSTPFIFLNNQKSAERSRFDAAHELGHLIRDTSSMKHDGSFNVNNNDGEDTRQIEKDANTFAAAFLMPEQALRQYQITQISIEQLLKLKAIFGVSITALASRMYSLNMITEWVYNRVLCPQFAQLKYRTNEPRPMKKETSKVWEKLLLLLEEDNISIKEIANQLNIHENDISDLIFKLTKNSRNQLRIVK
ncbi:XRE family transcriptional regulator [Snodgrassella sp. ESL0324]|uniref:XRE family transcriptional regulator n=1 Tax=Snodgrassella sp. ESL0324 TaxID=2705033 RepID=UPI0015D1AD19|nr:XRE family transcriptional regulator [Snodgrassella sp. ESL0324]